jgi:C-terminal processing protease CtpA/Prc
MKKLLYILFVFTTITLSFSSCEVDPAPRNIDPVLKEIDNIMHSYYLWYEGTPQLSYKDYLHPQAFLEALRAPQDIWSFTIEKETLDSYFREGEDFGYGFFPGWENSSTLRVMFCYANTEAYKQGVRRGWVLQKIDNIEIADIVSFNAFYDGEPGTTTFTFIDDQNITRDIKLSKETYRLNAVLNKTTVDVEGTKVGYLAYQSFLEYSETELDEAVAYLMSESIDELVIDLRFNTGGHNHLAEKLADVVVAPEAMGNTYYRFEYNNLLSEYNENIVFNSNSSNLGLSRIFFLTNDYSASASELIINGLKPHMDVYQIGDTTSGKPYSMATFEKDNWYILPIVAKIVNANGSGDYTSGLIPDFTLIDLFQYDWGDERDPLFAAALYFIQNGTFDPIAMKSTQKKQQIVLPNRFNYSWQIIDTKIYN